MHFSKNLFFTPVSGTKKKCSDFSKFRYIVSVSNPPSLIIYGNEKSTNKFKPSMISELSDYGLCRHKRLGETEYAAVQLLNDYVRL
jgi:hypothetical protein